MHNKRILIIFNYKNYFDAWWEDKDRKDGQDVTATKTLP